MVIALLVLLGLCFGSFVNALVWRIHEQAKKKSKFSSKELSISKGRSMCTHCGHALAAQDLIPVLSWVSLRGKCRYCRKAIPDTPFSELLTPVLFVLSFVYWPHGFDGLGIFMFVAWLVLLVGFVALFIYDLRWQLLPNRIVFVLMAVALIQVIVEIAAGGGVDCLVGALWGVVFGAGIFWVLFQVSGGRLIGGGDVKLGVVYGLLLGGPINSLLCIFLASIIGTFVALPLVAAGRAEKTTKIPFGPYLITAVVVVYLFGADIVSWYRAVAGI